MDVTASGLHESNWKITLRRRIWKRHLCFMNNWGNITGGEESEANVVKVNEMLEPTSARWNNVRFTLIFATESCR